MGDFVHRLAHAHGGGKVEDDLDALKRATQPLGVAHVAAQELHVLI
jgi:hypothetical protein